MAPDIISTEESFKISVLITKHIITCNQVYTEFGLMINFDMGTYWIMDKKKWLLAKIKYGV